jgi:hypothetical protein
VGIFCAASSKERMTAGMARRGESEAEVREKFFWGSEE